MSDENKDKCDYRGQHFGAMYPDAVCIHGYLWDLDSCDAPGGELTIGGDDPCPRCNREDWLERRVEALEEQVECDRETIRDLRAEVADLRAFRERIVAFADLVNQPRCRVWQPPEVQGRLRRILDGDTP